VACGQALGTINPADLVLAQARATYERGDAFGARQLLEDGVAESPSDFGLRLALAAVLLQDGEVESGYAHLEQLQTTHAWSPVVQAYAGGALLALGRVSDAKDVLDEAVERAPTDFYVLLKRGELFCRLGIYETAVDALERAMRSPTDDRVGREAARRLLRFARDKARTGFVRRISGGLRLPLPRKVPGAHSRQAWGM
jgi:tetratricopeptide (TPR) repeat protein